MTDDDYEWARELASLVKARDHGIVERRERASLLRRLAAAEGRALWEQLQEELKRSVAAFNDSMNVSDGIKCGLRRPGNFTLSTDTHTLDVHPTFDADAISFVQYTLTTTQLLQRNAQPTTRRIEFGLTDDDQLTFLQRQTDSGPVLVKDLARIIVMALFPWASRGVS